MGLMDILLPLLLLGGVYYLMQTGQLDKILTGAGLPAPPPPFGSGAKPEKPLQLPTPQQPTTSPPPSSGPAPSGGGGGSTATGKTIYQAIGNIMTAGSGVTIRGGGSSFRDNIGYPCNKCAREATWIFKPGTGGDWSPKLGSHGDEGGKETLIELGNISINGTGGDWRCEGPHMTYNDVSGGSGSAPKIGGLARVGIKAVTWPLGGNRIHHELWWDQTGSGNNWKKFAEFNGAATGCNAITCPVPGSKCQDTMRLDNPSGHQFIARSMVEIRPGAGGGGGGGTTTAPTPVGGGDTVIKKVAAVITAPARISAVPVAAPTGSDRTNLSFTAAGYTSTYHLYAGGLNWSRPVGLLIYTDGSAEYGLKNPSDTYLLAGGSGMIAVAKRHNMVLLTPLSPNKNCSDGDGSCWYQGDPPGYVRWLESLVRQIQAQYRVDKRRVAFGGYSSGAQLATEYWVPSGAAQRTMTDGVIVAISFGGSPKMSETFYSPAFKANVHMNWNVGQQDDSWLINDETEGPAQGYNGKAGYDHYTRLGFQTSANIIPGLDHDRDDFGSVMDAMISRHVPRYTLTTTVQRGIIAPAIVAPVQLPTANNDNTLAQHLLLGLGTPRITPKRIVTVTGTISGCEPHFAPDGDLVFGLMPDPQFKNLLTPQNATHKCSGGGLWCEGMCQKMPNSLALSHPWHQGDCVRGGPFPKFPTPKVGDRYTITGMYAIDHREGGHAEIHPITRMSKL